jgi:hypothetical protein
MDSNWKKTVMNKKGTTGFRGHLIAVIVVILFIFFTYNFIGEFISTTNPDSELLSSKYKINQSLTLTKDNLDTTQTEINKTSEKLSKAEISAIEYIFVISKAFFTIPIDIFIFMIEGITLIPQVMFTGLGGTGTGDLLSMGLGITIAIMIITLVLLGIKLARTGESET